MWHAPHLEMLAKFRFYWVVAACGGVLMALEILSSRVLAPHFGNSVYVWGSLAHLATWRSDVDLDIAKIEVLTDDFAPTDRLIRLGASARESEKSGSKNPSR